MCRPVIFLPRMSRAWISVSGTGDCIADHNCNQMRSVPDCYYRKVVYACWCVVRRQSFVEWLLAYMHFKWLVFLLQERGK